MKITITYLDASLNGLEERLKPTIERLEAHLEGQEAIEVVISRTPRKGITTGSGTLMLGLPALEHPYRCGASYMLYIGIMAMFSDRKELFETCIGEMQLQWLADRPERKPRAPKPPPEKPSYLLGKTLRRFRQIGRDYYHSEQNTDAGWSVDYSADNKHIVLRMGTHTETFKEGLQRPRQKFFREWCQNQAAKKRAESLMIFKPDEPEPEPEPAKTNAEIRMNKNVEILRELGKRYDPDGHGSRWAVNAVYTDGKNENLRRDEIVIDMGGRLKTYRMGCQQIVGGGNSQPHRDFEVWLHDTFVKKKKPPAPDNPNYVREKLNSLSRFF